jgi:hypothetical protein
MTMAHDPLAQYRRTPTAPAPAGGVQPSEDTGEYVAFGTKDKVHRLDIRCAAPLAHLPSYNILHNITYDRPFGTNFILTYGIIIVLVRGQNLQKMIFAIGNHMADFIQEFDPKRWAKPTDATAAFIESIEVKILEGGVSADEL